MKSSPVSTDTSTKILEISRNLFAHKGFHAVSTREIARASKVAASVMYHYFRSKRELLETLLRGFQASWTTSFPSDLGKLFSKEIPSHFFNEILRRSRLLIENPETSDCWSILLSLRFHDSPCHQMLSDGMVFPFRGIVTDYLSYQQAISGKADLSFQADFITRHFFGLMEEYLSCRNLGIPHSETLKKFENLPERFFIIIGLTPS